MSILTVFFNNSLYTIGINELCPIIAEKFYKEQNFEVYRLGDKSERIIFEHEICLLFYSTTLAKTHVLFACEHVYYCWLTPSDGQIFKKSQLSEILTTKICPFLKNKKT